VPGFKKNVCLLRKKRGGIFVICFIKPFYKEFFERWPGRNKNPRTDAYITIRGYPCLILVDPER
jgi:hypothetical protein